MHTKLPLAAALILVLGPSALCIMFGVFYHLFARRRISREHSGLSAQISKSSQRRDETQSILLVLAVAVLGFGFSTAA